MDARPLDGFSNGNFDFLIQRLLIFAGDSLLEHAALFPPDPRGIFVVGVFEHFLEFEIWDLEFGLVLEVYFLAE